MWFSRDVGRLRKRRRLIAAVAASALLSTAVAGSVFAAGSDSLRVTQAAANSSVEKRIDQLIAQMTLEEKLEQIQLLPDFMVTEEDVRKGLGSVLSLVDPVRINQLQHIAVEQSRLHIPMLFAFDTIHGFRTIFPIPLGAASVL